MRVRIIKRPPLAVDGVDLSRYYVNRVYDVSPSIAAFLIIAGWARVELRRRDRTASDQKVVRGFRLVSDT